MNFKYRFHVKKFWHRQNCKNFANNNFLWNNATLYQILATTKPLRRKPKSRRNHIIPTRASHPRNIPALAGTATTVGIWRNSPMLTTVKTTASTIAEMSSTNAPQRMRAFSALLLKLTRIWYWSGRTKPRIRCRSNFRQLGMWWKKVRKPGFSLMFLLYFT